MDLQEDSLFPWNPVFSLVEFAPNYLSLDRQKKPEAQTHILAGVLEGGISPIGHICSVARLYASNASW